jgi:hypothetical protein
MLRVYTRYQEKVNSLWITPNLYSMIYTLPWVTPGTPVNSVSLTVINSANWDKREFSTWVCEQLCEGLHLRLDHNQRRTIPGITMVYSVWCWLILHKFNSSEYLVVSEFCVPRDSKEPAGMCHKKCILIPCIWFFLHRIVSLSQYSQMYLS